MKSTADLFEKAKTAKTAEELLQMAEVENIEITAEEAVKAFAKLNKTGELSDYELDNISGGCGEPDFKYDYGNRVLFRIMSSADTLTGVI